MVFLLGGILRRLFHDGLPEREARESRFRCLLLLLGGSVDIDVDLACRIGVLDLGDGDLRVLVIGLLSGEGHLILAKGRLGFALSHSRLLLDFSFGLFNHFLFQWLLFQRSALVQRGDCRLLAVAIYRVCHELRVLLSGIQRSGLQALRLHRRLIRTLDAVNTGKPDIIGLIYTRLLFLI